MMQVLLQHLLYFISDDTHAAIFLLQHLFHFTCADCLSKLNGAERSVEISTDMLQFYEFSLSTEL